LASHLDQARVVEQLHLAEVVACGHEASGLRAVHGVDVSAIGLCGPDACSHNPSQHLMQKDSIAVVNNRTMGEAVARNTKRKTQNRADRQRMRKEAK
jgi:hypothetical protein